MHKLLLLIPLLICFSVTSCTTTNTLTSPAAVQTYTFGIASSAAPFLTSAEKSQITSIRVALQGAAAGTVSPQQILQIISQFSPTTRQGAILSVGLSSAVIGFDALYNANSGNPNVAAAVAYVSAFATGLQAAGF